MTSTATPRFSVFTPSHRPRFLDECLATLQAQTCPDWEWIVLLNNGARWRPEHPDERIRVEIADDLRGVGAAKRRACELARGEILVELDHDDLLAKACLAELAEPSTSTPTPSSSTATPRRSPRTASGTTAGSTRSTAGTTRTCASTAASCSRSDPWPRPRTTCPTSGTRPTTSGPSARRVRQGRRVRRRAHGAGRPGPDVPSVPRRRLPPHPPLSVPPADAPREHPAGPGDQRVHPARDGRLYDRYIEANALAWTFRRGLVALDLGAAHRKPPGYVGVDRLPGEGVDIVATLPARLDLPDDSVGLLRAVNFLEHVPAKVPLINELYRLLAPGGMLLTSTPSSDGRGAYQDPNHVAYYNENSSGTTRTTSTAPSCPTWRPGSRVRAWPRSSRPSGIRRRTSRTSSPTSSR